MPLQLDTRMASFMVKRAKTVSTLNGLLLFTTAGYIYTTPRERSIEFHGPNTWVQQRGLIYEKASTMADRTPVPLRL